MTILDKIVQHKIEEVAARKKKIAEQALKDQELFGRATYSFKDFLQNPTKSGIIAEFKRRSPSKGDINPEVTVEQVTTGYVAAGASGLSVLTDTHYFGGTTQDLITARKLNEIPILRKDFIIDPYQITEARAMGADVILLIAECLEATQLKELAAKAKELNLSVLMEIHSAEQLEKLCDEVDVVGVNNRNLKDFTVSLTTSLELADLIPDNVVKISESGISDPNAIVKLKQVGFEGFLIGEYFMKSADPGATCKKFIERIKYIEDTYNNAIA